jgi:dipeptidyl aminopeptidase/acylaminoacyl peptidase
VAASAPLFAQGFTTADVGRLRAVNQVALARDGSRVAYTVVNSDRPGRPYPQIWIMDLGTRQAARLGSGQEVNSDPSWSPDGKWLAYFSSAGGERALWVAHADGTRAISLGPALGSNSPLPGQGAEITWSPDSRQVAFLGATPGSHTAEFAGDPMVITRYLYRPTMTEGFTRFTDNRHLHIFIADVATRQLRQLTHSDTDEHSIDWSPDGKEILFVSNHEPNTDEFLNYDIFAVKVADGVIRRLVASESCEYAPRWSPDGKSILYSANLRGLNNQETTGGVVVAAASIWTMDANGRNRRDVGGVFDQRQGLGQWAPEGDAIYFPAERRGSLHLMRIAVAPSISISTPDRVVGGRGTVTGWSIARGGLVAYAMATPYDMGELFLQRGNTQPEKLTDLNRDLLAGKKIAEVESFTFISNDNKYEVEAFLTIPPGVPRDSADMADVPKHPLIVSLHGGPHAQSGPAFSLKNQIYASRGWAVLHVNFRGSAGYGQAFQDAVIGEQNGNEAQDVLYGVSAAVRRYLWLDRERMGLEGASYGGQLTMWLLTQTNEFKAAVPTAGISNFISWNYVTYPNSFEAMLWGQFPHQGKTMDVLWQHSAMRYIAHVHTPTLILHGENDSDCPIGDSEQYFIALKDIGVPTVFVRYPREGHGLAETKHVVDSIERSIAWYEKYFPQPGHEGVTNVQP